MSIKMERKIIMKVHGYKNTEDDKLLSLNEASIYCTIEELEKFEKQCVLS